jgi:DNA processing protein
MRRKPAPDQDAVARLRLARTEGVGPITYRRLLRRYLSAEAALDAVPRLARAGGRATAPAIPDPGEVRRELDALAKLGARMLFLDTPGYPALLALLDDAPPALAVLGGADTLGAPAIAMVGGRNASANGQRIAESLAEALAQTLIVVSGLARGIDAAAHRGALLSGRTVAAVAGGLDMPYPPENADLQRRIAETGAVVSEAPLGTAPQARHFPRRNRIIAGLSLGVVVVEAAPRSGSLITARIAQEAGREVFAVPGSPLDPRSRGANDLLRQGAVLTETAADVLDNLPAHPDGGLAEAAGGWEPSPSEPTNTPQDLAEAQARLLELLSPTPVPVDDLVRRCQLSAAAVMAAVLDLELAGRAVSLPGNRLALLSDHNP